MKDFIDYVMSFYGPGEIYDMGVSRDDAWNALCILFRTKNRPPFVGDSIDREAVRDILIDMFGYKWPAEVAA